MPRIMTKTVDLIWRILDHDWMEDPLLSSGSKLSAPLKDRTKQSLEKILQCIRREEDLDKINAFRVAYENILSYFWKRGYDRHEISYYFHELCSLLEGKNFPNKSYKVPNSTYAA